MKRENTHKKSSILNKNYKILGKNTHVLETNVRGKYKEKIYRNHQSSSPSFLISVSSFSICVFL